MWINFLIRVEIGEKKKEVYSTGPNPELTSNK